MWGAAKAYTRKHCLYTLPGLRETIPVAISQDLSDLPETLRSKSGLPVAPLYLQRRWARISRRYMMEYRKGADACSALKTMTKSKRHRDPNDRRARAAEAAMSAAMGGM